MKLTKPLALAMIAASSLLMANNLQARPGHPPQAMHQRGDHGSFFEKMAAKLNLTAKQQKELHKVFEHTRKKMMDVRHDSDLSAKGKREKMWKIRKATQAKMKKILTPKQLREWREYMRYQRRDHKNWHHNHGSN